MAVISRKHAGQITAAACFGLAASATLAAINFQPSWGNADLSYLKHNYPAVFNAARIFNTGGGGVQRVFPDGDRWWASTPQGWTIFFRYTGHGWTSYTSRNQVIAECTYVGDAYHVGNSLWGIRLECAYPNGQRVGGELRWCEKAPAPYCFTDMQQVR